MAVKENDLGTDFRFTDLQTITTGKNLDHIVSPLRNEGYDAQNKPLGYTVTHPVSQCPTSGAFFHNNSGFYFVVTVC